MHGDKAKLASKSAGNVIFTQNALGIAKLAQKRALNSAEVIKEAKIWL